MGMLSEWRKLPPKTSEGLGVKTAWIHPDGIISVSPAFSTTLAKLTPNTGDRRRAGGTQSAKKDGTNDETRT